MTTDQLKQQLTQVEINTRGNPLLYQLQGSLGDKEQYEFFMAELGITRQLNFIIKGDSTNGWRDQYTFLDPFKYGVSTIISNTGNILIDDARNLSDAEYFNKYATNVRYALSATDEDIAISKAKADLWDSEKYVDPKLGNNGGSITVPATVPLASTLPSTTPIVVAGGIAVAGILLLIFI